MASQPTTPRATALALLETFKTLDYNTLISLIHPDAVWTMHPASLGFPPQSRDSQGQRLAHMFESGILDSFPVNPLEVIESVTKDEKSGNEKALVTVHAEGEVVLSEKVKGLLEGDEEGKTLLRQARENGGLKNEYLFVITFEGSAEDGGGKIERVQEWLDAEKTRVLMGVLKTSTALLQSGK
ncbi:uncharacterized protein AB675_466 [Cyphellophora attinorum]|uniref:SnoaL-like domain-containing protein n=1 Tax=Cyphellophora attinorum TaxID=1664694 RepID=A0A0N1HHL8_9EURO|nr:uncharacterized protein AB675_466 [Phialophora attinorum]KPI45537.1 hypothetical protein AB675_466 [Phialophora attinorum]